MPLTQDQLDKVQSWSRTKGVNASCPACGRSNWEAGDLIAAPSFTGGGMTIGGPTIPMLPLVCANCATVRLFAAVPMGLAS